MLVRNEQTNEWFVCCIILYGQYMQSTVCHNNCDRNIIQGRCMSLRTKSNAFQVNFAKREKNLCSYLEGIRWITTNPDSHGYCTHMRYGFQSWKTKCMRKWSCRNRIAYRKSAMQLVFSRHIALCFYFTATQSKIKLDHCCMQSILIPYSCKLGAHPLTHLFAMHLHIASTWIPQVQY